MELKEKLKKYRISSSEYDLIRDLLGRPPEGVEWALFSALWSEHCSYKSSKVHLRKFYGQNASVVSEEGENAGIIDLGEDEKVAFKMESHNHPSFIEPYEGAATGVGGILRDIFTMGARPVALANYLCFGEANAPRMQSLVDGVVRGISGYGNCVGVPMLTGQTQFDPTYNQNILVNAFALGLFRKDDPILTSGAKGVGNYVVYVGAKTGRDGIHGASMSSESFDSDSESKRPTIQKGDPFYEKLLIESCLEVMKKDLVVAIQDMGAAGLTSSSFEMAGKSGLGLSLYLDRVPLRDSTMTPEDILLSESQERMLLICEPKKLKALQAVFEKWGLDAAQIGEVLPEKQIHLYWRGEKICSIDPQILTENAPRYQRPYRAWEPKNKVHRLEGKDSNPLENLQQHLTDLNICSKQWIYQQYDQRVGTKTVWDCSAPIGVLRLPDSGRGLGIALGCRTPLMKLDAQIGAIDAIAHPALQLAAQGFHSRAVTDCLNFGNPENPDVMSEFVVSVESISALCKELDAPVISGNVSFYNETLGQSIASTPATALVGLRASVTDLPKPGFTKAGADLFVLRYRGVKWDSQNNAFEGELDIRELARFIAFIREISYYGAVNAAAVVGRGGLAVTLAKMSGSELGVLVDDNFELDSLERLYEVVFEVESATAADFKAHAKDHKEFSSNHIDILHLGKTQQKFLSWQGTQLSARELKMNFEKAWENKLGLS